MAFRNREWADETLRELMCQIRRKLFLALVVALGTVLVGCTSPKTSTTTTTNAFAPDCPKPPRIPTHAEAIEASKVGKSRGLLYEIRRQSKVVGHLYGTVHANRYERISLGTRIIVAVHRSDVLAVELNLRDPDTRSDYAIAAGSSKRSFAYTPAHLRKIDAMIEKYCAPESLRSKTPAEVFRSLLALDTRSKGVYFEYGVENMLSALAKTLKKPVHSLESVEDHLIIRDQFNESLSDPANFISNLDTILSGSAADPAIKMVDAWADGDIEGMRQYCAPHCATLSDRVARDPKMAAGIDALIKSGKKVFAAVGSVHLLGERSVQRLLVDLGYSISRVPL